MDSIDVECNPLKREYDKCFDSWFINDFLKGKTENHCEKLFSQYRKCLLNAVKKKKIDLDLSEFNSR